MTQITQCDIAIIGAGAAGLSLAAGASQLGAKVVLIESAKMGGDCLNYGCVPSKSLLAAAKAVYQTKTAGYFGANCSTETLDFHRVIAHVQKTIIKLEKNDSVERFESFGVKVIKGAASFIDENTLAVNQKHIKAKRIVVATGSAPFVPDIPGLNNTPYLTNETVFSLSTLPKHLIVLGGGPIGCELAQAFAMLGSKVTLVEGFNILPKDDPDCVSIIRDQFEKMGIVIHEQAKVLSIENDSSKGIGLTAELSGKKETLYGSHLLVSTGRRANVAGLDLEKAGVEYSAKGIKVNASLRTTNKHVYAMGDVAGSYQFTHIANYHAGIILKNILFRLPAKVDYRAVPWVTYTEPEMAHVGLTQDQIKDRTDVQVIETPFLDNDRAQTEHETQGKIKVFANKKGKILGVTIVGEHAGELILPWVMAIREGQSLRAFTDVIIPYPTLSEASKRVASAFYTPKLFSDKVRLVVKWLLKLG